MSDYSARKTFPAVALDKITPMALELIRGYRGAGMSVWIVGGAIRDFLRGKDVEDIDLVVDGDPAPIADSFARRLGLGFVTLDKERGIIRLAFKEPAGLLIDVSRINGESIEEDLRRRDFTVNSIAALWTGEDFDILDPIEGAKDLASGVLRLPSPDSLIDDPLRVARAYRFWLVYGLEIPQELTEALKKAAPLLPGVAQERVSHELLHILGHPRSHRAFRKMGEDGVLKFILPEVAAGEGVGQNEWHHLDVLAHTMETLERLEEIVAAPPRWLARWTGRISDDMSAKLSCGADRLSALKLAALFHDAGKPEARSVTEDGRVTFYGHEKTGETMARKASARLRLPGAVAGGVAVLTRNHLRPFNAVSEGRITERAMFRFLRDTGEWGTMAILLALADAEATKGPAVTAARREDEKNAVTAILLFMEKMEHDREKTMSPLNGKDIMDRFGLSPGPLIGVLLDKLDEAAALREIHGRDEAFEYAGNLLNNINIQP